MLEFQLLEKKMDNDVSTQSGNAQSPKEEDRMPEELGPKTRAAKPLRKLKPQSADDGQPIEQPEDANTDEFYAEVLQKFGIQI
jgi:hypothetical protein